LSQVPSCFGFSVSVLKISPQSLHVTLEDRRLIIISSGTHMFIAMSMFVISASFSACGIVRGNPSRINPFLQSSFSILFFNISITISSGTRLPLFMNSFTLSPISVFSFMFFLNRSPVEMCGTPRFGAILEAYVPFPEPGAPRNIFLILFSLRFRFLVFRFLVLLLFLMLFQCRFFLVLLFQIF